MATDLIGIDKVEKYILKSDRHDFSIRRPNQNGNAIPIFESENSNPEAAAKAFVEWAEIFSNDNSQVYEIHLYDGNTDKNKNKSVKATFQLNEGISRKTTDKEGNVIIQHPAIHQPATKMGMAKTDVDALISAAVEKVQTNHLIQSLSAQIAELSRKLEEQDLEDEEDEEEEEEEEPSLAKPETWRPDTVKEIISFAKDAYMEAKGAGRDLTPGNEESRRVAGPEEPGTETEEKINGKKMELKPAFQKPADPVDQDAKIRLAIQRIYKLDGHIGDDLMLVADMAEKNYDKFKGLILSLRDGDKKL